MASIKRIASGEGRRSWEFLGKEKRWKCGRGEGEGAGKEIRARSVGANLCSARMEIYGPLIGGVGSASGVKRWETEMEREWPGMYAARNF